VSGPILIGGEHRSGTTLVSLVLDSHPQLTVGPELDFREPHSLGAHVLECCALLAAGDPRVAGEGVATRDPAFALGVQFVRQCERFGVEPARLAELTEAALRERGGADLVDFADRCALIDRLGRARRDDDGSAAWGIKIQRSIVDAEAFARVWPDARFVHVVRDGRDVAASQLRGARGWGFADAAAAAAGWLEVVEAPALRRVRAHTLRYEDLVADPRATLAALLDFLELPWSDAPLAHQEQPHALLARPYGHPSSEAAAHAIDPAAVGRYARDLAPAELRTFERIAGAALERHGYALATPRAAAS